LDWDNVMKLNGSRWYRNRHSSLDARA
jgi:hypothetical protein